MLWIVAISLGVLWALGMISSHTIDGYIHILLVVALVVVTIQAIQGKKLFK